MNVRKIVELSCNSNPEASIAVNDEQQLHRKPKSLRFFVSKTESIFQVLE